MVVGHESRRCCQRAKQTRYMAGTYRHPSPEPGMGTDENKAVVSRFINEVTTGRNLDPDLVDELCAPNYVNVAMGNADLDAFKAMGPAMLALASDGRPDRRPGPRRRGGQCSPASTTAAPSAKGARQHREVWRTTASPTTRS
jgi:hypothetical protein